MHRLRFFIFCLGAMLLAGCAMLREAPIIAPPTKATEMTPTAETKAKAQVEASSTPTLTLDSTLPPTTTQVPTQPPPQADWRIYEAALRPAVARDLDAETRQGRGLTGMTQYSLTVSLASGMRRVDGSAHVRYTNREQTPLDAVYFHLFPNLWNGEMRVSHLAVAGQPTEIRLESDDDLLRVPLRAALLPGETVEIALDFQTPIPTNSDVGNYADFAYLDDVLAMAHFYPTVVVYDDGGWRLETPAMQGDVIFHDASLYDVSLTAPADWIVAATGETLGRAENGDGTATWRLVGGPMRDFNIAASQRYQSASQQVGDVKVTSYYLPEHTEGGQKTLRWAARALPVYEAQFGPYPYRELDIVETATTAGGIEYPGLVVIAGQLYNDSKRQDFFEGATVHEVAHQWWYNVVGNDQVNHPWLDEALAQYSTYFYYEQTYGAAGGRGLLDSLQSRWSRVNFAEMPIDLPVGAYSGPEYSAIVYGRAPLLLFTLRDRIGAAKMDEFLRRYYATYTWGVATPADFRRLAEEIAGEKLDDLWLKWGWAMG